MHHALQPLLKGKRVLQIGLGVQGGGLGLARYIAQQVKSLTITDKKNEHDLAASVDELKEFPSIQFALGGHPDEVFTNIDLIIIGPSVPWDMPQLIEARKKGIEVTSEIELFFKAVTVPVIGITGTRGKTTTTTMIVNMLSSVGKRVAIGGNIAGNSTIEILDKQENLDYIVLELSSWQLAVLHRIKKSPHIAVFTNFYPDHLNFYPSMDAYWYDKTALFAYQKPEDILIVDESLKDKIDKSTYQSALQWVTSYKKDLSVPGSHNRSNAALAEAVGRTLGIPDEHIEKMLYEFKGVPYRLQKIETIKDVDIYNDTTSTTPIALITAITAMKEQQYTHTVLIMGGNSKNLPYGDLVATITSSVDAVVLLKGTFSDELLSQLPKKIVVGDIQTSMESAVSLALDAAQPKGCILFSPGATSFAMFKNEFDRGEQFNAAVYNCLCINTPS